MTVSNVIKTPEGVSLKRFPYGSFIRIKTQSCQSPCIQRHLILFRGKAFYYAGKFYPSWLLRITKICSLRIHFFVTVIKVGDDDNDNTGSNNCHGSLYVSQCSYLRCISQCFGCVVLVFIRL